MSYDMTVERLIDGTPEEVFDAFIDREAMKEWYAIQPDWETDVQSHDSTVGGRTTIVFGGAEKYREDVTYSVIDRPHRIVYREDMRRVSDGGGFLTEVTVTFVPQGDKTLLTLVQSGFHDAARRDAHQQGWPQFIDRFEQVVAKRRAAHGHP